jgi:hypothetical protein
MKEEASMQEMRALSFMDTLKIRNNFAHSSHQCSLVCFERERGREKPFTLPNS